MKVLRTLLVAITLVYVACGSTIPQNTPPDSGSVAVDGGTLYYESAGKGAPVILIHGGFGDRRMWDQQFLPLSQVFRVVRYDHRGFGNSPAAGQAYSPVADLARLMDHLKIPRANLVGNSMGGTLALDFAFVHPDRTGAVVVIASTAGGYPDTEEDRQRVMAVLSAARARGTAAAAALWLRHPMVSIASTHPIAAPLLGQMVEDNQKIFLMEHWPEESLTPPAYERLKDLKAQVLFLVGENDVPLVREGAKASADRIRNARLEMIPGTDHLPQMEEPARINKLLVDYIATNGC
jgi:pimeloyl-ACP methyl ester carboxylesterase